MAPLRLAPGLAEHEEGQVDDVVDRADPTGRDHGPQAIGQLAREEAASPLGIADRARCDRVDPDAPRPPFHGQRAGHRVHGRLGGGDVHLAGRAAVVQAWR